MVDYGSYIRSDRWRSKHPEWLRRSRYRCSMFPWIVIGRDFGNYHPYRIHHTHYKTLGKERLWLDVLPLSPVAHNWIIHGLLSGWRSPSQQRHYPNAAQQLAHLWCRLPILVKTAVFVAAAMGLGGLTG